MNSLSWQLVCPWNNFITVLRLHCACYHCTELQGLMLKQIVHLLWSHKGDLVATWIIVRIKSRAFFLPFNIHDCTSPTVVTVPECFVTTKTPTQNDESIKSLRFQRLKVNGAGCLKGSRGSHVAVKKRYVHQQSKNLVFWQWERES